MVRAGAALTCAALLLLSARAEADPSLTERLRLQGGYSTEQRPAPAERVNSFYAAAVPELVLAWVGPSSLVTVSYQLTGAFNSQGGSSEIANRVVAASQWELSQRTTLLVSAEAAQTSFSNFLVARSAAESNVALIPSVSNHMLTTRVSQGLGHQLSQRVRLSQNADASYLTSIAGSPPLETYLANLGVGAEHLWRDDAVGLNLRASYANTRLPAPAPSQEYLTFTGAPNWRHDWSPTLSTNVSGGATVVVPAAGGGKVVVSPYAQASASYLWEDTTLGLNYSFGISASPLTGQIIRSNQATASVFTPLSRRHRVTLGASAGFLHGELLDLANPVNDQTYNALMTDTDVTWQVSNFVSLFARYQFIAQIGDVNVLGVNPSFLRDFFLVGVQFSSRAGGTTVPTGFSPRVDGGTGGASGGGASSSAPPAQ